MLLTINTEMSHSFGCLFIYRKAHFFVLSTLTKVIKNGIQYSSKGKCHPL